MKKFGPNRQQIYPAITVKIFSPGNKECATRVVHSRPGQGFTEDGIYEVLEQYADWVDRTYIGEHYRLVKLAPNQFNFVHAS